MYIHVPDTASYIRGWMQMVLTPNDLFSWNNKYSKYMVILLRYIHYNRFLAHLPAMHVDLLCACWYSWAVKGSSSLFFCRLLISLRFTSCLLLSPKLTDAPYFGPGTRPPFPLSRWRLHSQDPHTLPSQGTRQYRAFHLNPQQLQCTQCLLPHFFARKADTFANMSKMSSSLAET